MKEVRQTHRPNPSNVIGFPNLDHGSFSGWRTQSLAYLKNVFGPDHTYPAEFEASTDDGARVSGAKAGREILLAAADDIEHGYLADIKEALTIEVFSDFLEMAGHLLDGGAKGRRGC